MKKVITLAVTIIPEAPPHTPEDLAREIKNLILVRCWPMFAGATVKIVSIEDAPT